MAALTASKVRNTQRNNLIIRRSVIVDTGETLYQGSLTTLNGNNGAEAATTTNPFIGVSIDYYTEGQTAILEFNHVEAMILSTTPAVTNIGKAVYCVDSGSVTLTSTSNSAIVGFIVDLGASNDPTNTVYVKVTTRA